MPSVAQWVTEQPFHHFVVDGLFARVDDALKKKVALFQLVVEEVVGLREKEIFHARTGHDLCTNHVGTRKQPATSAAFLVADAGAFHLVAEPRVGRSRLFAVGRKLFDGVGIYGIPDGFVGIVVRVALFQGLQDFGGECLLGERNAAAERKGQI